MRATGCELLEVAYRQTFTKANGRKYSYWDALRYHGLTRIILTTSHLDRNPKNNRFSNLQAKCQRCHLLYDMPEHVRNRNYGIDHAGEHQLQLFR